MAAILSRPQCVNILLCIFQAKWLHSMHIGGAMIWSLDLDDFDGKFCNAGKFPLANALKKALRGKALYVRGPPKRSSGALAMLDSSVFLAAIVVFVISSMKFIWPYMLFMVIFPICSRRH